MNIKKVFTSIICVMMVLPLAAQKRSKKNKQKFTPIQLAQIQQSYKRVFQDSLQFTSFIADTVATIERDFMIKKRDIMLDRSIAEEDKEMMKGMLDADRDAKLGSIISVYDLEKFRAFLQRNEPKKER